MTQCADFSLGLSLSAEWKSALYASLALGSDAAALKEDSISVVAFLTMVDAVEPSPNLLPVFNVSLDVEPFVCREYLEVPGTVNFLYFLSPALAEMFPGTFIEPLMDRGEGPDGRVDGGDTTLSFSSSAGFSFFSLGGLSVSSDKDLLNFADEWSFFRFLCKRVKVIMQDETCLIRSHLN